MFLINGREQDMLAASDRATQFGDGCFTTARITDGEICFLQRISSVYRTHAKHCLSPSISGQNCKLKWENWLQGMRVAY